MIPLALVLGVPAAASVLLALVPSPRAACWLNVGAAALTFAATLGLVAAPPPVNDFLMADAVNLHLLVLTGFVTLTTALFSRPYVGRELAAGRMTSRTLRLYHAAYQALVFGLVLALCANNIGLMWIGIETAALVSVVMVGLHRTGAALEAAWKYFVLGSAGVALALFGTILVYFAGQPAIGGGSAAMAWTELVRAAAALDPAVLNLAFVFLLVGYGARIGLVPLHGWLPDAHAEGPTPVSAVLSGLLLNVALYVLLRFKRVLDGNVEAMAPGPLMVAMGIASLLFGAFMLYRRHDVKRLFAYSSIGHMGLATFAFGLGGPVATFAGMLHLTLHSLGRSAVFFAVGQAAQMKGSQRIAGIGGLTASHPALGWSFVAAVAAIAGLPPLGLFASQFLIVTTTIGSAPLLAVPLVLGLLVGLGGLLLHLQAMAFGPPTADAAPQAGSVLPILLHLAPLAIAGIYLPPPLAAWFQAIAALLE